MPNFSTDQGILFALSILWSLAWKGVAMWKAVKANHKTWYIALLVLNTLGILEILYIFIFNKMGKKENTAKAESGESKKKKVKKSRRNA